MKKSRSGNLHFIKFDIGVLKMRLLLLISFLSLSVFGTEKYPPMKDEVKNIEDMINKLESDVEPASSTQAVVPAAVSQPVKNPQPVKTVDVPSVPADQDEIKSYVDEKPGKKYNKQAKIIQSLSGSSVYESGTRNIPTDRNDVYYFAYMPPIDTEGFNKEGVYDGKFGHIVFTACGDYVIYYRASQTRNTWGADVQFGGQFDISPFALAILLDGSVRGANTKGAKLYGLGPRLRASYRANSWIFPFLEGGVEFAKLENMDNWVSPFTVIGGGVMFRFGKVDRKSEISLHRDYGVAQMLLIIAIDVVTSPQSNINTPSNVLAKAGVSFEFF
ncbi:MAG: hypothetical protein NTY22_05250 [Proteobacteria bacterium]|nr:hypothetical protein [Pseudomonadota bacterium]